MQMYPYGVTPTVPARDLLQNKIKKAEMQELYLCPLQTREIYRIVMNYFTFTILILFVLSK